jgi:hypothetical protein
VQFLGVGRMMFSPYMVSVLVVFLAIVLFRLRWFSGMKFEGFKGIFVGLTEWVFGFDFK